VAEAAVELQNETSFPEERPSEDWVARYVESASQVPAEEKHCVYTPEMYAALLATQNSGSPETKVKVDLNAKKHRHHHATDSPQ
jgi:hypothetical protein